VCVVGVGGVCGCVWCVCGVCVGVVCVCAWCVCVCGVCVCGCVCVWGGVWCVCVCGVCVCVYIYGKEKYSFMCSQFTKVSLKSILSNTIIIIIIIVSAVMNLRVP